MNEEVKRISELTERLLKMEEPLPETLSLVEPAEILSCLQLAREPMELLQNLREKLAKVSTVKIFNTKVKLKLLEIKKKKTPTDRIAMHLRFVHMLTAESEEELLHIDRKLPEKLKRIRQDSQLKTELNEFFGPLYAPDWGADFDSGPLQDFMFDIRADAYGSTFKPEKYLDWAWEVMNIINPEQYGERSHSGGTLVVSQTVPSSIDQHLQRLKTCYLLGLDEMAIVFCRSVLEAALFKALHQRGKLPGGGNVDDIKPYEFARLLGLTDHRMLGVKMKDRAKCIGRLAGDILHTDGPSEATENTEEIIKNTFGIVEELYG